MAYSDSDLFLRWWSDAWTVGNWSAAWSKAVDGLTPAQAAWSPPNAPGVEAEPRKSVWQIVEHMIFWREVVLARMDGASTPSDAERETKNLAQITDRSEAAWADTRRRFEDTHRRIGDAVRTRYEVAAPAMWLLPHDSYHIGQVAYLRAMLGLPPIE
jgi:hypothetical protein